MRLTPLPLRQRSARPLSILAAVAAVSVCACAPALPGAPLPDELKKFAVHTDASAKEAAAGAEAARAELERSEMLVAEARALAARAEQAERRCEELISKIPKRQTRRVYRVRPTPTPKAAEGSTPEAAATPKPSDGPIYSPSDAPLGKSALPKASTVPPAAASPAAP